MKRENSQSCQIALNIFRMSECNFKNQINLLHTAILQRKSFRTLTLLINNIKETKEELRKAAEELFLDSAHPSPVSSENSQPPGPTVANFNDNSNPNSSHFAQLPQFFPPTVPWLTMRLRKPCN